jgi:hypothetical protein
MSIFESYLGYSCKEKEWEDGIEGKEDRREKGREIEKKSKHYTQRTV